MAIRTVVTRGFGNGTFSGTIADVVKRGYAGVTVAGALIGPWSDVQIIYSNRQTADIRAERETLIVFANRDTIEAML